MIHTRILAGNLSPAFYTVIAAALILPAVAAAQDGRLPPAQPAVIERIPLAEPVAVIEAAYPLADGSVVVVADPRSSEPIVFVIDSTGSSRRIGRKGEGPGEYTLITASAIRGDSIVLFQRDGLRLTVLDLATGRGRTNVLDQAEWRSTHCTPSMVISEGAVCQRRAQATSRTGAFSYKYHWVPFGVDPESAAVLYEVVDDSTRLLRTRGRSVWINRYMSWGQRSARSPSHRMFAVMGQQRVGTVDTVTLRFINLPSGIANSWTVGAPAIQPTGAERERIIDSRVRKVRDDNLMLGLPDAVPDRAAVERAFAMPSVLPAYRMFHIGDDGCAWLRRNTTEIDADDPFEYDVFDFSGRLLESVRVALPVRLSGVTCNYAIGILFEESGELGLVRISPQPQ